MSQISFTPKNQHVYDEFKTMWLQYQLDHKCSLTAPEFLKVVLGGFKERHAVEKVEYNSIIKDYINLPSNSETKTE